MDVAAILQALLGAGAPTAGPGTGSVAGALEASFAALFAAAAGTDRPAVAGRGAGEEPHPATEQQPDDHSPEATDAQALAVAGTAAAAAFVPPSPVPGNPVQAATAATAAPPAASDGTAPVTRRGAVETGAAPVETSGSGTPTAAPEYPTPADGPVDAGTADASAVGKPAEKPPIPASREITRTTAPERAPRLRPVATAAAAPDASGPETKVATGRPAIAPKGEADASGGAARGAEGAAARDADGDAVERPVDGSRRGAGRPVAANGNGHAAPVQGSAPGSDTETGGREPGRRGADGAVVVAGARRLGEVSEPKRSGSGADPSGPSSLPPPAPARESARTEASASEPSAAHTGAERDVDRLMRLDQLRPVRVRDGGDMRLEVSPEGLGRVEVRVAVRADAVHAALYAQQDHARDALVAHRPMLEAALGRSQLRLESFSVGLGQHELGDPGRQGAHAEPAHDETPAQSATRSAPVPAAAPSVALEPAASRGLSLRA